MERDYYKDGYNTGLTWNADWVPGGPWVMQPRADDDAACLARCAKYAENNRLWLEGWHAGNAVNPDKPITVFLRGARSR